MVPASIAMLANVVMDNSNIAIGSCILLDNVVLESMYGNPFIIVINNMTIYYI